MKENKLTKWLLRAELPGVPLLAFFILGVMFFFTSSFSFLNPVERAIKEFSMTDLYYQILHETGPALESPLITIVDMTEYISRRDLAAAIETVEACAPKVIGVDIVFEGRKEDVAGDSMIAEVAASHSNIIWSYKLKDYANDSLEYMDATHSFFTEDLPVREGVTNMQRQLYGGVKRVIDQGWLLRGVLQPSFIGEVANAYADKEVAQTATQSISINFTPTLFRVIPADSVLMYPELITDRIVLFGAMNEEADMHYTPLGKMPGIYLLAYGVQTVLKKNQVTEVRGVLFWVISFALVLITYWCRKLRKAWISSCKHSLSRLLLDFPLMGSVLSFMWVALLLWVSFLLFCGYDISFNLGLSFSAIAFLLTAENTYASIIQYSKDFTHEE